MNVDTRASLPSIQVEVFNRRYRVAQSMRAVLTVERGFTLPRLRADQRADQVGPHDRWTECRLGRVSRGEMSGGVTSVLLRIMNCPYSPVSNV